MFWSVNNRQKLTIIFSINLLDIYFIIKFFLSVNLNKNSFSRQFIYLFQKSAIANS